MTDMANVGEGIEEERDELVKNFRDICQVSDEVAGEFLLASGWHLESAVQEFFQEHRRSEEGIQNRTNLENEQLLRRRRRSLSRTSSTSRTSTTTEQNNGATVIRSSTIPRSPLSWYEWTRRLFTLPMRLIWLYVFDVCYQIFSLFRNAPLAVTDANGDVRSFISDLETRFGLGHAPLFNGSYNDALIEAKSSLRFLLIYLHSDSHPQSARFVNLILCSREFIDFIANNNLLLWGCNVQRAEGYRVSMALRETTYPFMGLLCMRDHRMVMVLRLEDWYDLGDLLSTIRVAIEENRVHLDAVRAERNDRETTLRLRREQEADYQRSLAADRARQTERRRVESLQADEERRQRDEADRLAVREAKMEIMANLPAEPKNDAESIRVSVKFPDGTRFERRFLISDSLEMLFNVTLVHERCPINFSLLSSYPRRQLDCAPDWYRELTEGDAGSSRHKIATFHESGFDKAIMVLVQDNNA